MIPVSGRPGVTFSDSYRTTFPALANGKQHEKTAVTPVGRGLYRNVDTSGAPFWSLPDQYKQKAQRELAAWSRRQPDVVLPTQFVRSADGASTFSGDVAYSALVKAVNAGRATDQLENTRRPRLAITQSTSGGLPAYPGSSLYYAQNRQALQKPAYSGIQFSARVKAAQARLEAQAYVDANGFRIKQKPQVWSA